MSIEAEPTILREFLKIFEMNSLTNQRVKRVLYSDIFVQRLSAIQRNRQASRLKISIFRR